MKRKGRACCIVFIIAFLLFCGGVYSHRAVVVTQYEDQTGYQAMFYTIKTKGKLIVIDGGHPGNVDYVKQVIKENGNHVDAWILTHPHSDHIGVFNEIWANPDDMTVEKIYTIEMNYDKYKQKAMEHDEFDVYEEFLNLTKNESKLQYVHAGDEWEVAGLKFEVLSAYSDETVDTVSPDLANDGSMMFKVTNKKESMLFCADVGQRMSEMIIKNCADKLPSDYIQMGHHGNGGLSEDFYKIVSPKAAFFDAPEWLMNPEGETTYTTPKNRELMESMGAEIYYYATAPNRIKLK